MAQPVIQPSFASGELAPSLYARIDLAKFHSGAALLRNFWVDYRGGVSNRTGTSYVGQLPQFAFNAARLIPFQFSTLQAYALVFYDRLMRVVMDGGVVLDHVTNLPFVLNTPYAAKDLALLKWTQSADVMTICHPNYPPYTLTRTAHDAWTLAPVVFGASVPGPTNVVATPNLADGTTKYAYTVTAIGANGLTESLGSAPAVALNSKTMSTTAGRFVVLTWDAVPGAQLYNVYRQPEVDGAIAAGGQFYGFVGSSTSLNFVDNNILPDFTHTPPQSSDPFNQASAGQVSSLNVIDQGFGYQTVPGVVITGDGTGATGQVLMGLRAARIGFFGNNYRPGDIVSPVGGTFTRPARLIPANVSAGSVTAWQVIDEGEYSVLPPTTAFGDTPISGGSGTGASLFAAYAVVRGVVNTNGVNYTHANVVLISGFPQAPAVLTAGIGGTAGEHPTCTAYFQDRQVYAATQAAPDTLFMSKTADYPNFGFSVPARPDDSIVQRLVSREVNAIKHLIPMNSLIAFTSQGAWKIDAGSQGGAVTPSTLDANPQAFNGCSDVPPLVINYDVLYVQAKGAIVRDLAYNFYVNVYTGSDLTTLSNHLFAGHQIVEWAWAEEPNKLILAVRDDGVLLSFTYLKEQEIYGWSHHDTTGQFVSICTIPEGDENAVYFIVRRYINGNFVLYLERLQSRVMGAVPERQIPADLTRAWFVDSGLARGNTIFPQAAAAATALTAEVGVIGGTVIAAGAGYVNPLVNVEDETGTGAAVLATVDLATGGITGFQVTAYGSGYTNPKFNIVDRAGVGSGCISQPQTGRPVEVVVDDPLHAFAPHVGDIFRLWGGYGRVIQVNPGTTPLQVIVDVVSPFELAFVPSFAPDWSCTTPISAVTGLDHLEGELVTGLADGSVISPRKVVNGGIALDQPAASIVVGMPYVAQFKSLYLDVPGEAPTVQGKRKSIPAVTMRVQDTRGLQVGHSFDELYDFKERTTEPMGVAIKAYTGDQRVPIGSSVDVAGQVCAQQANPLPVTILGFIPEVEVGDT